LPDPGDPKKRQELCEKIGGKVVEVVKKKKLPSGKVEEQVVEEVRQTIEETKEIRQRPSGIDFL
jgi:hypothetical protein